MKTTTMICLSNYVEYSKLDFPEYLGLPGYSYSGIKNDGADFAPPTDKMILGTHVHQYLLEPEHYKHEDSKIVRPLAVELKKLIGGLLPHLRPELAVSCLMEYNGFAMPYKGRMDLCIPGRIVLDIKVGRGDVAKAIEYFGYDYQISGYCIATKAKAGLIASIDPVTFKTSLINIPLRQEWWKDQILKKGDPIYAR